MKKHFEMSIDNPALVGGKHGIDACLKMAIKKAIDTGSMEGSATLKVSFELMKHLEEGTGEVTIVPQFTCKFGYSVPMKKSAEFKVMENSRVIQNRDGEYMLVNDQVSMDELMEEEDE